MKQIIFLFFIGLTFLSCSDKKEIEDGKKIQGLWTLYIMEQQDSVTGNWNEWREGMQGYILYANEKNMAIHIMLKGYEKTPLRFPNFSDTISLEALKHITKSYVYFAKYTLDEKNKIVEHARISHSNPGMWNEIVRRKYSFIGDTLVLEPIEKEISGIRLKWIKQ